jgi:hypothetical protein
MGMVGLGAAATALAIHRRQPRALTVAMAYFTVMEALQWAGYGVADQCADPANRTITLLSYLHIAFQPFFINAVALELVPPPVKAAVRRRVYALCAAATAVMLAQLVPSEGLGPCRPGDPLCGAALCLVRGDWHIAWNVPYNGLMVPLESVAGTGFGLPTYVLAVFVMPVVYGAWRFAVYHALVGPVLASLLTTNPNEMPAIWCLFSIGILLVGWSPRIRSWLSTGRWWLWPRRWLA